MRTFDLFWPDRVELQVYAEQPCIVPRRGFRSLWSIPGALAFNDRHKANPVIGGRAPMPCWKDRERETGYSFRTDALKFWKQILIPEAAAKDMEDGDLLVWLDGDVETTAPIFGGQVPHWLGSADIAFLGREPKHSEIGFWAVRLNPRTRDFLHAIAEQYRSDAFLELPQWHSAFIWDHVRRQAKLVERNLTPRGASGHVWPASPLGRYMRHDKGQRKPRSRA